MLGYSNMRLSVTEGEGVTCTHMENRHWVSILWK